MRQPLVFFERRHLGDVVSRFDSIGSIQRTLTGSFLEALIGTVMQDDQLFAGSIADNISFFDSTPDWEFMQQCATVAAVHEEFAAMPMQYHTMVGDMGLVLSGGQKQRVIQKTKDPGAR